MSKNRTLVGLIGTGAAALLLAMVPQFEGKSLIGYRDPAGIATVVAGRLTRQDIDRRTHSGSQSPKDGGEP